MTSLPRPPLATGAAPATLARWLTGPRFAGPARAATPTTRRRRCPSSSSRRGPRRWRPSSGPASAGWSRWRRASSRSPTAPAAARRRAPMRRSRGSCTETALTPAAHLTCVGAGPRRGGRGRAPLLGRGRAAYRGPARRRAPGGAHYAPHPGGYAYAADLVAGLHRSAPIRDFGRGLSGDASDGGRVPEPISTT